MCEASGYVVAFIPLRLARSVCHHDDHCPSVPRPHV